MTNATPIETEEEQTKPEPALTNAELVFGSKTNRADFAENDRWADPNDPQDHGETEARFRWLHGPMALLLALLLGAAACGGAPTLEPTPGAVTATACDPYAVGGNRKCSPRADGTAEFVECQTYPYNKATGEYQGDTPVEGCTLDFLAAPGVPYTATCVEVCP